MTMRIFSHREKKQDADAFGFLRRDIHSHLLPGLDDGSPDMATSLDLIGKLRAAGLREFICTPHIFGDLYRNGPETILPALEKLQHAAGKQFPDVVLSAAAEYMLDDYFMSLLQRQEKLLTVNDNFILTELPFSIPPANIEQITFGIFNSGYQPILAHPERYAYYYKNPKAFARLKELGFTLQLNLLSLTGYYGRMARKTGLLLLKENLVDFVGTDLHHMNHLRALTMPGARKIFRKYLGEKIYNEF